MLYCGGEGVHKELVAKENEREVDMETWTDCGRMNDSIQYVSELMTHIPELCVLGYYSIRLT